MRIGICENEDAIREQLEELLRAYPTEEILDIALYARGEDMLADQAGFDLVFLDIELGAGLNGLAVAEALQARPRSVIVVFVSSYAQYVSDAFYLDTFQFLLKPLDTERFTKEFTRCLQRYHGDHRHYTISCSGEEIDLAISQIVYITVEGRKLAFYVKGRSLPYETKMPLKACEKSLLPYHFAKCNQGSLINLRYIDGSAGETVRLSYPTAKGKWQIELPVSRRQKRDLQERIRRYVLEGDHHAD